MPADNITHKSVATLLIVSYVLLHGGKRKEKKQKMKILILITDTSRRTKRSALRRLKL